MSTLGAAGLLELWERADSLPPIDRAVALAAASDPAADEATVGTLPLGRRDARLLRLRAAWSAARLDATATCPACHEQVEFSPDTRELLAMESRAGSPAPLGFEGVTVVWRSPDSTDLAAAAAAADADAAERTLLDRCTDLGSVAERGLPEGVRAALADAMAAADPLAEVLVGLACPSCDFGFTAELDVPGIVWAELTTHVQRLLREVDVLARSYGWTQDEVLGLGQRRRDVYLELAEGSAP